MTRLPFESFCRTTFGALSLALICLSQIGCGAVSITPAIGASPVAMGSAAQGSVYGGRQPISGASILLFAAGASGYGSAATSLLTSPVTTAADGTFSISQLYRCSPGQQLYIVAVGGNPGAGLNSNVALMAALGDCSTITSNTYISINEITTVGTVFALAPFMTSYSHIGAPASNLQGLARAFQSVNKLVSTSAGTGSGPALPAGAKAPTSKINSLAEILAVCVNSLGGAAGDNTPCGNLFSYTMPGSSTAPTDTAAAVLSIARNPSSNVIALFKMLPAFSIFQPILSSTPADWSLAVTYAPGLNAPATTSIDGDGNVWIANAGNNTLTVIASTGAPLFASLSGNGLSGPSSVAIDASGSAWVTNVNSNTVSIFARNGSVQPGSPVTVGASPSGIAVDLDGSVWVTNRGSNTTTQLDPSGTVLRTVSSYFNSPAAIVINSY